jgi:hypothetical protein
MLFFLCVLCPQSTAFNESGSFKLFSFHTHTHTLSLSPLQDSAQNEEEEEEEKEEDYNVQRSIASTLDAFTSYPNPNFI